MVQSSSSKWISLALGLLAAVSLTQCATQSGEDYGSTGGAKAGKKKSSSNLPIPTDSLNDTARFLAGMPGGKGSPYSDMRRTAEWQRLQANLDHLFSYFENTRSGRINSWRRSELGGLNSNLVFYPFGGPDFLFANTFFPSANTYVLCGLEPVGSVPNLSTMSQAEMAGALENLRGSMATVLSHSYFITKDMRGDLSRTKVNGTLPIVMVFLARSGYRIDSVNLIDLNASGVPYARAGGGSAPGFHIVARGPGGTKNVYYFQEDLANGNLGSDKRLLKFVQSKGTPVTYLKSASYLMHHDYFSVIRNAILAQSSAVVQDPSGVPFRSFDPEKWNIRLYGRYTGTLDMFSEYYQKDLAAAYSSNPTGPLSFGVGYKQDSIIVARRK